MKYLWLIPLGFGVGAYGTLIGAGGGFVLVPILLLLYPQASPDSITSISLAVVFFNALSGSIAYARMRRIDYQSGLLFSAATIPGAVLGAITTGYIPRRWFDLCFAILMLATGIYLVVRPQKAEQTSTAAVRKGYIVRRVTELNGITHVFSYNPWIGILLSMAVGYISSLLGIGGGIIHVPALVKLLNFPVHIATATSHFILAVMALAGTVVHIVTGAFHEGVRRTIYLSIGVVVGAQLGAWLSERIHGDWIIRGLGIALALVGIRLLLTN